MIKFVDLQPRGQLRRELDAAYERVMSSGRYIGGTEVETFEQEWAKYCGFEHCIACSNGFDALQLILRAHGIGSGDRVLVPAWTATPTWSGIVALGAVPIVEGEDFRAVISVHLYGFPSWGAKYKPNIPVIQDAAQAHGLRLQGTCAWSFYPTKNLGAYGDAGAITTNDAGLVSRLRDLRRYGCPGALNSCMDPLQAAFLHVKLPYLDGWNERRREMAGMYLDGLRDVPGLQLPHDHPSAVWHQFVVRSDNRDKLQAHLAGEGIETMIHYPIPPHRALGYDYDLPEADRMAAQVLSLPIGLHLTDEDVKQVIKQCRH